MNYVVRMKNVKVDRLNTILNYLTNDNHKNHTKHNTQISELSNREQYRNIADNKIVKNKVAYMKNGKGGKPLSVFGKSLTFNIPPSFEMNEKLSKDIYNDLVIGLKELYKNLPPFSKGDPGESYDLDENELYSVFHNQNNPHWHVLVPYLSKEGKTLRGTKSKVFLSQLKALWSEIVMKHYNVSLEEYQPESEEEKNMSINRRYLNDLKEYYLERIELHKGSAKWEKNQIKSIERLLELNDNELESADSDKKIERLEYNYEKTNDIAKKKTNIQRI